MFVLGLKSEQIKETDVERKWARYRPNKHIQPSIGHTELGEAKTGKKVPSQPKLLSDITNYHMTQSPVAMSLDSESIKRSNYQQA